MRVKTKNRFLRKILTDRSGVYYKLLDIGNGNITLQSKRFPEIGHVYKRSFIESAIKSGLLNEVEKQMKLSTQIVQ